MKTLIALLVFSTIGLGQIRWISTAGKSPQHNSFFFFMKYSTTSTVSKVEYRVDDTPMFSDSGNSIYSGFAVSDSMGDGRIFISLIDDNRFTTGIHTQTFIVKNVGGDSAYFRDTTTYTRDSVSYVFEYISDTTYLGPVGNDTVSVKSGWNMVATSYQVALPSISSAIIISPFFTYNKSYITPTLLMPNTGYWIKVSQDGKIVFPRVLPPPPPKAIK